MIEKLAIKGGEPIRKKPFPRVPIIEEDDIKAVVDVLKSRILNSLEGTKVKEFEDAFASYYGVKHAVAVSSGTAALHAAVEAVGIGPGDEAIVPPFTMLSTASSILMNNAIPVFADIDPRTYLLDANNVVEKITDRTKAIIPVHMAGQPCDMDQIMELAEDHNLVVIEDSAQAHGAEYKGQNVGTIGDISIFSLMSFKAMCTGGEGGIIITDNDQYAKIARMFRNYYRPIPSEHIYEGLGYNYRMQETQGALGLSQLKKLNRFNEVRIRNAEYLLENLKNVKGLNLPYVMPGVKHVWWLFVCTIDEESIDASRDELSEALTAEGIPAGRGLGHIPTPVHLQKLFTQRIGHGRGQCPFVCPVYGHNAKYYEGMCPNAEKFAKTEFVLPFNHAMSVGDMDDIITGIKKVFSAYT